MTPDDLWDLNRWDAEPGLLNTELWERLVRGECARVVILSPLVARKMLEFYFPQTLGLPPLPYFSVDLTPTELAARAETLAAGDRWITEGLAWAEYFMPRAEAIISVETEMMDVLSRPSPRLYWNLGTIMNWANARRRKHKARRRAEPSMLDLALDAGRRTHADRKPAALAIAEDDYPDKLIRVSTWQQIRALKKVRAPL